MMKRPYLTVLQDTFFTNMLTGVCFLIAGALWLVNHSLILGLLISFMILATLAFSWFSNHQKFDEMARAHLHEAYHIGYLVVIFTLIILELIELCGIVNFPMLAVTSLCIGTGNIAIAISFRQIERDGDL